MHEMESKLDAKKKKVKKLKKEGKLLNKTIEELESMVTDLKE